MLTENSIAFILLVASSLVYPDTRTLYQGNGTLPQNGSKFQYLAPVRANHSVVVKGVGKECEFFCYLLKPVGTRLSAYTIVDQSEQGCDLTYQPRTDGDLFLQMRNPTDVPIHYTVSVVSQ